MTKDQIETLLRLAGEAPGRGRWRCYAGSDEDGNWGACAPTHEPLVDDEYEAEDRAEKDAAFIAAASPDVVRALCEEVQALRAVADVARARCRDAVPEWAPELRAALAAVDALKGGAS